jgi:putative radical SAM enzyme (TIGR03279 family)
VDAFFSGRCRLVGTKKNKPGIFIRSLQKWSAFYRTGIRKDDVIISINGEPIHNDLEFHYFAADEYLEVEIERDSRRYYATVSREEGDSTGITFREQPIQRCANRCVFCFIDQMPKGLRKRLYIKDEDIRLSLFDGNYVTLSTSDETSLQQIVRIGLSPLYISVHATDHAVRNALLGNPKAFDILKQLRFLAKNGIRFHTQIVVCPGYNDGAVLLSSLRDLLKLGDALLSVAVVPVGLTRFHRNGLSPVGHDGALTICKRVEDIGTKAAAKDGCRKIFLADEMFIKAGLPLPSTDYYEEYPQIENGVGLVRRLLDEWEKYRGTAGRGRGVKKSVAFLAVTSISAFPYINKFINEFSQLTGKDVRALAVPNRFFGDGVTVAGLLTARDVLREIKKELKNRIADKVLLPGAMFNYNGYTLDGYSRTRIEHLVGIPVTVVDAPADLVDL